MLNHRTKNLIGRIVEAQVSQYNQCVTGRETAQAPRLRQFLEPAGCQGKRKSVPRQLKRDCTAEAASGARYECDSALRPPSSDESRLTKN